MALLVLMFLVTANKSTLAFGIVALILGRVHIGRRKVVTGAAARWIGVVLVGAIPVGLLGGIVGFELFWSPFQGSSDVKIVAFPLLAWFGSVFVAVMIGECKAKHSPVGKPDEASGRPLEVMPRPAAKVYADHELCYLCGKPLGQDELTARVCRACW